MKRYIQEKIENQLYKGRVIVLYGARRVGKTFLSKQILKNQAKSGKKVLYINCELLDAKKNIETTNEQDLKKYLGNADFVVFDEAQHIKNIGLTLKILVDTYPEIQIMATGSSSFDLANNVGEPLVGRKREFILYPLSMQEIIDNANFHEASSNLDSVLLYGLYPAIYKLPYEQAKKDIQEIASSYLYKDILMFENIKNSSLLLDLLQLLALQIGNEVSYNELATKLGINVRTVEKYIDLFEKCFIVFSLRALRRNIRNEVSRKSKKIYFYDLGIRNALIQNFNKLDIRQDSGALWENFCIIERLKHNQAQDFFSNQYFWRMYSGQEIDYIEEHDGKLDGYEFKYSPKAKVKKPSKFLEAYENSSFSVVHRDNWFEFLLKND
jgi:uncharacterized protein